MLRSRFHPIVEASAALVAFGACVVGVLTTYGNLLGPLVPAIITASVIFYGGAGLAFLAFAPFLMKLAHGLRRRVFRRWSFLLLAGWAGTAGLVACDLALGTRFFGGSVEPIEVWPSMLAMALAALALAWSEYKLMRWTQSGRHPSSRPLRETRAWLLAPAWAHLPWLWKCARAAVFIALGAGVGTAYGSFLHDRASMRKVDAFLAKFETVRQDFEKLAFSESHQTCTEKAIEEHAQSLLAQAGANKVTFNFRMGKPFVRLGKYRLTWNGRGWDRSLDTWDD